MVKDDKMLSLYDYLGKPAGKDLGGEVVKAAKAHTNYVKLETREVSTRYYTGKVVLYPKWFLDEYFATPTPANFEENDLPF
jgi:hypothetical protein